MEACIVVPEGSLGGTSFLLGADSFSIGRGAKNHLDIPDPEISAQHCVIRQVPENSLFEVEDRHSLNGTYVNNVRVGKALLSHGDRISIGDPGLRSNGLSSSVDCLSGRLSSNCTRYLNFSLKPRRVTAARCC
jgi:pSer/pThr/pTyr-binding forkhead associated (FHA) protein